MGAALSAPLGAALSVLLGTAPSRQMGELSPPEWGNGGVGQRMARRGATSPTRGGRVRDVGRLLLCQAEAAQAGVDLRGVGKGCVVATPSLPPPSVAGLKVLTSFRSRLIQLFGLFSEAGRLENLKEVGKLKKTPRSMRMFWNKMQRELGGWFTATLPP